MSMNHLLEIIRSFDGVLELAPGVGSAFPQLAWGDHFFYYAPDGQVPQHEQPYATVVTKDYPDDAHSDLDHPGRWRLNIHVGVAAFTELTGEAPRAESVEPRDHAAADVVLPHPVYRAQGWVCMVLPDADPRGQAVTLLRQAHENARRRAERRGTAPQQRPPEGTAPTTQG